MKQLKQIYFKQNEKFEYEFFEDKEYLKDFKFSEECKNLYIELKNGDITPAIALDNKCPYRRIDGFTLYVCGYVPFFATQSLIIALLKDTECDYSKYIPDGCAVVFLNEEDEKDYEECFASRHTGLYADDGNYTETFVANNTTSLVAGIVAIKQSNKYVIFIPELTSKNIKEVNQAAKILKEKYGAEWVGVFTPLYFIEESGYDIEIGNCDYLLNIEIGNCDYLLNSENINKFITTNATGLLKPQDTEHFKVIDYKEIFEEQIEQPQVSDESLTLKGFHKNLTIFRELRKKTQEDMGKFLGVTFQQYQKYESGTNRVSLENVIKLAEFLECDLFTLLFANIEERMLNPQLETDTLKAQKEEFNKIINIFKTGGYKELAKFFKSLRMEGERDTYDTIAPHLGVTAQQTQKYFANTTRMPLSAVVSLFNYFFSKKHKKSLDN